MLLNSVINRCLAGASLSLVSSLALAQTTSSVTVGPAVIAPVPTLSSSLLIALGLLLAAIAVRTLRGHNRAQKLFSVMLLGGGLVLSGIGIDRTLAGETVVVVDGAACSSDTGLSYDSSFTNLLRNDCSNSVLVKGFDSGDCPSPDFVVDDDEGGCTQGLELPAGQSCSSLPVCVESS